MFSKSVYKTALRKHDLIAKFVVAMATCVAQKLLYFSKQFDTARVARRVCEKNAQNVAQPILVKIYS
jgi:hypothetical protein